MTKQKKEVTDIFENFSYPYCCPLNPENLSGKILTDLSIAKKRFEIPTVQMVHKIAASRQDKSKLQSRSPITPRISELNAVIFGDALAESLRAFFAHSLLGGLDIPL